MNPELPHALPAAPLTGFDSLRIPLEWNLPGIGESVRFNNYATPFEYWWRGHKYRVATYTDGMSDPKWLHIFADGDPFGWAFPAALPHDGGYHDDLEIWIQPKDGTAGHWEHFNCDKATCDQMLFELLCVLAAGNEKRMVEARAIYEAVHLGGLAAFNQGRERAAERAALQVSGFPSPVSGKGGES